MTRAMLSLLALSACASPSRLFAVTPEMPDAPVVHVVKAEPRHLDHVLAITLGAVEFHGGDSIVIDSVRGTSPTFERGGTYRIAGHYCLASVDRASLLASVTVTQGSGRSTPAPNSRVHVLRGQGAFELELTLDAPGYPHLTFYADDGYPVGGVYFGMNEWLLRKKGWSYSAPRPKAAPADPESFELL